MSNLQSASNWQIRAEVRKLLVGTEAASVPLPPAVGASFEPAEALVGNYGRADSPAVIAIFDDKLFRGDNEFYPIEGERYYIPGSGTIMWFRRDATGSIDALISLGSGGRESVLPRLEP